MFVRGPKARAAAVISVLSIAIAGMAGTRMTAAQTPPPIDELMTRVGRRIAEFYERAQHVICIETSTVQPISRNFDPQGFSRVVESELRVEADGGDATILRDVRKVNGKPPRARDKKDRSGCTDPNPLSTEPLAFLLPAHRKEFTFRAAGIGKDRNRAAVIIEFASVDRRSSAELIEDPGGHPDCFDWTGHVASRGRIWVDATTFDVMRIDKGLPGMLDVRVPFKVQERHSLDSEVVIDREDTTIRYRTVAFSDPDEVLLLPESIETVIIARGGLQSTRRTQVYSDYHRFLGEARIVE